MTKPEVTKPEVVKQESNVRQFLNDIVAVNKYTSFKLKEDFFYDLKSDKIGQITAALCKFILDLPNMSATNNVMNRFKSQKFYELLDVINPLLSKYECKCTQEISTVDFVNYVVTIISHSSDQYFRSVSIIPKLYFSGGKDVDTDSNRQVFNSAVTNIKRVVLKSILGIDAGEESE